MRGLVLAMLVGMCVGCGPDSGSGGLDRFKLAIRCIVERRPETASSVLDYASISVDYDGVRVIPDLAMVNGVEFESGYIGTELGLTGGMPITFTVMYGDLIVERTLPFPYEPVIITPAFGYPTFDPADDLVLEWEFVDPTGDSLVAEMMSVMIHDLNSSLYWYQQYDLLGTDFGFIGSHAILGGTYTPPGPDKTFHRVVFRTTVFMDLELEFPSRSYFRVSTEVSSNFIFEETP